MGEQVASFVRPTAVLFVVVCLLAVPAGYFRGDIKSIVTFFGVLVAFAAIVSFTSAMFRGTRTVVNTTRGLMNLVFGTDRWRQVSHQRRTRQLNRLVARHPRDFDGISPDYLDVT